MPGARVEALLADLDAAAPASPGPLAAVSVRVAVDAVQAAGGVVLALTYRNEGGGAVALLDPLDQIQIMLLDEAGYPVARPPHAPRLLVEPWDSTGASFENRFTVLAVDEDGRALGVREEVARRTVRLAPGSAYTVTLRVDRIADPQASGSVVAPPEGRYGLVLTCGLAVPEGAPADQRVLRSDTLAVRLHG